jgi:lysophospholipase L1-like esterase
MNVMSGQAVVVAEPGDDRSVRALSRWTRPLNLLLFVITCALILEVCARVDDWVTFGAPLLERYDHNRLLANDDDGVQHNVPGARFQKWRINRLGFRGPEVSVPKPPGTSRIMCFGSSETFGLYEPDGRDWPSVLGGLLSDAPGIEVINSSVVGLTGSKRLAYFDRYVMPAEPDVVILYVAFLEYPKLAPRAREERAASAKGAGTRPATPRPPIRAGAIIDNIRVLPKLRLAIKKSLPPKIAKAISTEVTRLQLRRRERQVLGDAAPLERVNPEDLDAFERDLEDSVVGIRRRGIAVVLTTYPTLLNGKNQFLHEQVLLDFRRVLPVLSRQGIVDAADLFNDRIRRVARRLDVPLVDNDALIPKTTEYFGDNVHYTEKGAELVARNFHSFFKALGPSLASLGLVSPR